MHAHRAAEALRRGHGDRRPARLPHVARTNRSLDPDAPGLFTWPKSHFTFS